MSIVKKILVGLVCLILVIVVLELVVDMLFDNASAIDACLDMGGAWDYDMEKCKHN